MAPATTGVPNDILASTLRILRDKYLDSTFRSIPLIDMIFNLGNTEDQDGGAYIDHPLLLTGHSTITELVNGYESVNLSVTDPLRTGTFEWCDSVAPIVLTKKDKLTNSGERAKISIIDARLKQVLGMYKREVNKQILVGDSAFLTMLQTLNGIGTNTGWLEEGAFGTQTNTVGGIAKSDFTESWQNQAREGTFAATRLKTMQALSIDLQQYAPTGDTDLILASPASYAAFKDHLEQKERYSTVEEQRKIAGRLALQFNGADMYLDNNLGFTSGGKTLSMYFLNTQLFTIYFHPDAKFTVGEMESIPGYAAWAQQIGLRMQIAPSNLSGLGVLIGAET